MIDKRVLEPFLLFCHFICLYVHLFLHICQIFSAQVNKHEDMVRTHCCLVGIVILTSVQGPSDGERSL